jgi:hypothetical protein
MINPKLEFPITSTYRVMDSELLERAIAVIIVATSQLSKPPTRAALKARLMDPNSSYDLADRSW